MLKKKNICFCIMGIWLFMMMVLPNLSIALKSVCMLLFIISGLWAKEGITFNRNVAKAIILWEAFFIFEHMYNYVFGNNPSADLVEIYLVRPILLFFMMSFFYDEESFLFLFKNLLYISVCLITYNVIYILQSIGFIPKLINDEKDFVWVSSTFIAIRSINLTALMFIVPFLIGLYYKRKIFAKKVRKLISIMMYAGIFISMFSGRRALQIITIMTIFLFLIFSVKEKKITQNNFIKLFLLIILGIMAILSIGSRLGINVIDAIRLTIKDALDKGGEGVRTIQMKAFFRDWMENPIFGKGITAYSEHYIINNNYTHTWSYELFYNALLMQIGLVGVGVIGVYIFRIVRKLVLFYKMNKNNRNGAFILAVLAGDLGFLLCGATNPMITSTWFWFIVLSAYSFVISSSRKVT